MNGKVCESYGYFAEDMDKEKDFIYIPSHFDLLSMYCGLNDAPPKVHVVKAWSSGW